MIVMVTAIRSFDFGFFGIYLCDVSSFDLLPCIYRNQCWVSTFRVFVDANVSWNYDRPSFDGVVDFHRFLAVFNRIMGW